MWSLAALSCRAKVCVARTRRGDDTRTSHTRKRSREREYDFLALLPCGIQGSHGRTVRARGAQTKQGNPLSLAYVGHRA